MGGIVVSGCRCRNEDIKSDEALRVLEMESYSARLLHNLEDILTQTIWPEANTNQCSTITKEEHQCMSNASSWDRRCLSS